MRDVTDNGQSELQYLDALNTAGDLYLIRQTTTGRMLTGRRVNAGQAEVYRRLQKAQAPHTPRIRDIREEVDGQVLVLEDYVPGLALSIRLEQQLYDRYRAASLGMQLCEALSALHHAGLVHRDIKPENVIVTDEDQAYLIDFDITRMQKDVQSHDTMMLGTTGYAAPPLRGVVQKCTAMDPDNRYQTVEELRWALRKCAGNAGRTQAELRYARQGERNHAHSAQDVESRNMFGPGIPGFRSNNVWRAIIATAFYIVAGVFLLAILVVSFRSAQYFFIGIPILIGCVGTFLFAYDMFWLRTRCTWVESQRGSRWYGVYCFGVILLLWFACFVVMVAAVAILR